MNNIQLINKLACEHRIMYVGSFYFVVERSTELKELLDRYVSIYGTVQISGNGYGTGIQIMNLNEVRLHYQKYCLN